MTSFRAIVRERNEKNKIKDLFEWGGGDSAHTGQMTAQKTSKPVMGKP